MNKKESLLDSTMQLMVYPAFSRILNVCLKRDFKEKDFISFLLLFESSHV